jgi:dihydroxy-acid dehydratase
MSKDDKKTGHSINPAASEQGISKGLANYGDRGFSLFPHSSVLSLASPTPEAPTTPVTATPRS